MVVYNVETYKTIYNDIVRMMKIFEEERKVESIFAQGLKALIEHQISSIEYPLLNSYQPDLEEIEEFKNQVVEYHNIQGLSKEFEIQLKTIK